MGSSTERGSGAAAVASLEGNADGAGLTVPLGTGMSMALAVRLGTTCALDGAFDGARVCGPAPRGEGACDGAKLSFTGIAGATTCAAGVSTLGAVVAAVEGATAFPGAAAFSGGGGGGATAT